MWCPVREQPAEIPRAITTSTRVSLSKLRCRDCRSLSMARSSIRISQTWTRRIWSNYSWLMRPRWLIFTILFSLKPRKSWPWEKCRFHIKTQQICYLTTTSRSSPSKRTQGFKPWTPITRRVTWRHCLQTEVFRMDLDRPLGRTIAAEIWIQWGTKTETCMIVA